MAGRKLATRKLILRKGINSGVFSTTTAISATGIFRVIVKTGERSYAFNVLVQ
jgi:hypothetical protein